MNRYPLIALVLALAACSHSNGPAPTPPPTTPPADTTTSVTTGSDSLYWQVISTSNPAGFSDIWFTDTLHGFAAGTDGYVYASSDGGSTWQKNIWLEQTTNKLVEAFYFLSPTMGYVVGATKFAMTSDGGQSWTVFQRPDPLQGSSAKWPNMQFVSPATGYLATGVALYRTDDTGRIWVPAKTDSVSSVCFLNPTNGFAFSYPNNISSTTDGGSTWQSPVTLPNPSMSSVFTYLQFSDDMHGWFIDLYHLSITVNGGASWKSIFQAAPDVLQDIQLLSGQTVYLATTARLYKTMDGGATWQREYTVSVAQASGSLTTGFVALYFTDAHHGWACTQNGNVLRYRH